MAVMTSGHGGIQKWAGRPPDMVEEKEQKERGDVVL